MTVYITPQRMALPGSIYEPIDESIWSDVVVLLSDVDDWDREHTHISDAAAEFNTVRAYELRETRNICHPNQVVHVQGQKP